MMSVASYAEVHEDREPITFLDDKYHIAWIERVVNFKLMIVMQTVRQGRHREAEYIDIFFIPYFMQIVPMKEVKSV